MMRRWLQQRFGIGAVVLGAAVVAAPVTAQTLDELPPPVTQSAPEQDGGAKGGESSAPATLPPPVYEEEGEGALPPAVFGPGSSSGGNKLTASDGNGGDYLGYAVAVSGDTVLVGAHGAIDNGAGSGAVYVYERSDKGWVETAKLLASDGKPGDHFGRSVALDGNVAVIGADGTDDQGPSSGAAYVFVRDSKGKWSEQAKLLASTPGAGDRYGISAALDGDTAVAGAPLNDNRNGDDAGTAEVTAIGRN